MKKRLMLVVAVLGALTAPAVARADAVTQWNQTASTAFMVTAAQGPQLSVKTALPSRKMKHLER